MIYQNGNKWYYEHNGEIVAVEYTYESAKACGEARIKAMQPNNASSGLAETSAENDRVENELSELGHPSRRPANR